MSSAEEQATGCVGADSYRQYARDNGFVHLKVLDWSSSAGDWTFLVSKDGFAWRLLFQQNNYPRHGFSHSVGPRVFHGEIDEVIKKVNAWYA